MGCPRVLAGSLALLAILAGDPAAAQQVQITRLNDIALGFASVDQDATGSRNVCVSATGVTGRYSVLATGSGDGNAFTLAGAGAPLAYDVQWSGTANQGTGTALTAGRATSGFVTALLGLNLSCVLGNDTASLTVVVRAADLSKATAGAYTGLLTLLIAAE